MAKTIVIDASVTLDWLFDESSAAERIGPVLESHGLLAPSLWRLELVSVVLVRERRKQLTAAQGTRLLELLDDLGVEIAAEPPTRRLSELAAFARPHQLTAYDAAYIDLAVRNGLPLFTREKKLTIAARKLGVAMVKQG